MADRRRRSLVVWTCPECGGLHAWRRERLDVSPGPITMSCEDCGEESKGRMEVDVFGNATVEFPRVVSGEEAREQEGAGG